MVNASEIFKALCEQYQNAVSANDSVAYRKLFAGDAIRIPPGMEPEYGPDAISQSEQKDYDVAKWTVQLKPSDVLQIDDQWIYGIAEGYITTVAHTDGTTNSFKTTKTWLLQRQDSGEWLIKRQIWNRK